MVVVIVTAVLIDVNFVVVVIDWRRRRRRRNRVVVVDVTVGVVTVKILGKHTLNVVRPNYSAAYLGCCPIFILSICNLRLQDYSGATSTIIGATGLCPSISCWRVVMVNVWVGRERRRRSRVVVMNVPVGVVNVKILENIHSTLFG